MALESQKWLILVSALPGTGEVPVAPVYENGKKTVTLKGSSISEDFKGIIEKYIQNNYEKK
jgi:(E)-4-hydroxy-3-methylbut-2-enyl-diphosphate synthase